MFREDQLIVGVIGIGHWGPNVVRNFADHPRVQLRYVCDIDTGAFKRVSKLVPKECQFVVDASVIFSDEDIDAVVIITYASAS